MPVLPAAVADQVPKRLRETIWLDEAVSFRQILRNIQNVDVFVRRLSLSGFKNFGTPAGKVTKLLSTKVKLKMIKSSQAESAKRRFASNFFKY